MKSWSQISTAEKIKALKKYINLVQVQKVQPKEAYKKLCQETPITRKTLYNWLSKYGASCAR